MGISTGDGDSMSTYRYFDGEKVVCRDQDELFSCLKYRSDLICEHLHDRRIDKAICQLREVFKIKPVADGGLTDREMLELHEFFLAYHLGSDKCEVD